jgi:hypothetical protein
MDIIHHCLALAGASVPCLSPAIVIFKSIWVAVEQVHVCQEQLISLAQSTAQLLEVLNDQFRSGRLSESQNATHLASLYKLCIFFLSRSSPLTVQLGKAATRDCGIHPGPKQTTLPESFIFQGGKHGSHGFIPTKNHSFCERISSMFPIFSNKLLD